MRPLEPFKGLITKRNYFVWGPAEKNNSALSYQGNRHPVIMRADCTSCDKTQYKEVQACREAGKNSCNLEYTAVGSGTSHKFHQNSVLLSKKENLLGEKREQHLSGMSHRKITPKTEPKYNALLDEVCQEKTNMFSKDSRKENEENEENNDKQK